MMPTCPVPTKTSMRAWYDNVRGDLRPPNGRKTAIAFPTCAVRGNVALDRLLDGRRNAAFRGRQAIFGGDQAPDTLNMLRAAGEAGLFRVVMIHHPPIRGATPFYKRMIGIRRFAAVDLHRRRRAHAARPYPPQYRQLAATARRASKYPWSASLRHRQGPGGMKPRAAW